VAIVTGVGDRYLQAALDRDFAFGGGSGQRQYGREKQTKHHRRTLHRFLPNFQEGLAVRGSI